MIDARTTSIKPWVIFDLDNTLFDAAGFKKDIFTTLKACGVDDATAQSSFNEFLARHDGGYDMLSYCEELLHKKHLASLDKIHAFLALPLEQHLIPDAKEVLRELRARHYRLILLTKGSERFQNIKIERTGLTTFFNEIRIIEGAKEKELTELYPPDGSYFVNDRDDETARVMHAYPSLRYLLLKMPGQDAPILAQSAKVIRSLREILDIIR